MTVREIVPYLYAPKREGCICVVWGEHEYDLDPDSPMLDMFGPFLVDDVVAIDEYLYCIHLKERRPYMKEGDHEEN